MLMGSPLGIIGLIATFMLDRAGEISEPSIGYWTFAIIWIISGTAYTLTEPDWRQDCDAFCYRGSSNREFSLVALLR